MDDNLSTDHPAIELAGVTKRYEDGNEPVVAVDGLDLEVSRGEIFGFLGPNGAGKSTTINMLLGYTTPTTGTVRVLGAEAGADRKEIRHRIGVLPEGQGLYDRLTGRRHLEFAIEWTDANDDPDQLLERVALDANDAARPVGNYSKGMQQRLGLAMALVGEPELLILDEPSSGLDPHGIRRLRDIVRTERNRGATVFFSSHLLEQVEAVSDRVGILADGRLVAVDTINGLRKTVGSGTELQLRIRDGPVPELDEIAGVTAVERAEGILRVCTEEPAAKAAVVRRVTDAGVEVLDIDSTEASLEDVFAAYTGGDGEPARTGGPARSEPVVMAQ